MAVEDVSLALSRLSDLAGQQYATTSAATQAVLETITELLGMRTTWVSRTDTETCQLSIEASYNLPGEGGVQVGASFPLETTFCAMAIGPGTPSPLVIEDVRRDPVFSSCPAARAFPDIGSYIGVPIQLHDGSVFGTLCASDPAPTHITSQQAQLLSVMSRLLATQIERDRELQARVLAEDRFYTFMDHTPAVTYMKDGEGRYVYVNRTWCDTFGHDPAWMIGKTDADWLDADTAQKTRRNDQMVLQSGTIQELNETSVGPNGAPRYWYSVKFPMMDRHGVALLGGISTDITARRTAELQRALLAAIVQDTQDAIYAKTLDGVVLTWNHAAERLYGYTAEEMVGKTLEALIPPGSPDDQLLLLQRLSEGERVAQYETHRRTKDGRVLDVELTLSLIRDDEGNRVGVSTIARDITEHNRLIAQRDHLYAELQEEVARAAEIQSHLLPKSVPYMPGFEFGAVCLPAREVGGDFFDWAETQNGIRLTLGDVTGKGMPAALLMATTRAALRGAANQHIDETITTVNTALMGDLGQSDAFVTMFHAELREDGWLDYTDAGHGMAIVVHRDRSVTPLRHRHPPIGIADTRYDRMQFQLEKGDTLLVYSDGLPDARPDLGLECPRNIAALCPRGGDILAMLKVLEHATEGHGPRPDDLTLIAVRRQES